eukprot:366229-Chlamydomonas_euryale.AAC.33
MTHHVNTLPSPHAESCTNAKPDSCCSTAGQQPAHLELWHAHRRHQATAASCTSGFLPLTPAADCEGHGSPMQSNTGTDFEGRPLVHVHMERSAPAG